MNILSFVGIIIGIGFMAQLLILGVVFTALALSQVVILKREVASLRQELFVLKG